MLGSLMVPLRGFKYYRVYGGPYIEKPAGWVGVKMAKEIPLHDNSDRQINIPTQDFLTPNPDDLSHGLAQAVDEILRGRMVYVGCMAGRGRTGLFLAVLVKAFGVKQPVEYVREHYYEHAVETPAQYKFVTHFPIPRAVLWKIRKARWLSYFTRRDFLTKCV